MSKKVIQEEEIQKAIQLQSEQVGQSEELLEKSKKKKKGTGKGNRNPNMSGLIHFKPGYDPRRNNKGAPKTAIQVRKMIRGLASELVKTGKGKDEREVTRLQKLVLAMLASDSPVDRVNILKALYPELFVDKVDIRKSGTPKINVVYIDNRGKTPPKDDIIEGDVKDE